MRGMEEKTVSPSVGLREDEVLQSRRAHGENILSRQKRKSKDFPSVSYIKSVSLS